MSDLYLEIVISASVLCLLATASSLARILKEIQAIRRILEGNCSAATKLNTNQRV